MQFLIDKMIILSDVVRFPEDIDDESTTFHPEYSHQLYGDEYVSQYCILDSYSIFTYYIFWPISSILVFCFCTVKWLLATKVFRSSCTTVQGTWAPCSKSSTRPGSQRSLTVWRYNSFILCHTRSSHWLCWHAQFSCAYSPVKNIHLYHILNKICTGGEQDLV